MGRPTKLNPTVQAAVVQAIAGGNTRETSAAFAGITKNTFYEWLARGRAAQSGLYREFADAIEKAEADAVAVSVALIRRAAQTQWQAAAWWLERRYSEEWGRKDRVDVKMLIQREADRLSQEMGIDSKEVVREVERLLARAD